MSLECDLAGPGAAAYGNEHLRALEFKPRPLAQSSLYGAPSAACKALGGHKRRDLLAGTELQLFGLTILTIGICACSRREAKRC
jgi:hypothetical protein